MKTSDVVNPAAIDTLNKLLAQPVKGKLSFKLSINIKAIQPCIETFNASRKKLIEQYAKKGEDGKPEMIGDDKQSVNIENPVEFAKEMDALLATDVAEVCKIIKISQDELDQVTIAPADMLPILWMIAD